MNEKKDNTNEIMAKEKMVIEVDVKTALKRLIMVLLVAFWIIGVAKPDVMNNMMNKTKKTKAETTISKEIEMIEKTDKYIALFSDGTYVAADELSDFATKLSEATNKTYASEDNKLKVIDGGAIMTVEITVYKT